MYRRVRVNIQIAILLSVLPALALGTQPARDPIRAEYEAAREAHAQGDLAEAERKYLEVIRLRPGMAAAYNNLGIVYLKQRRYEDAVRTLERGLKAGPPDGRSPGGLGLGAIQTESTRESCGRLQGCPAPRFPRIVLRCFTWGVHKSKCITTRRRPRLS